jgi:hypothetical protein
LTALNFKDGWAKRVKIKLNGVALRVLDRDSFRRNKVALGRNKDLADIEDLV